MKLKALAACCCVVCAMPSFAEADNGYKAGQWVLRGGLTQTEPREDSDEIKVNGSGTGAGVGIDNDIQLGITVEYMLDNNWGIELLAATPFEHTATATGSLAGLKIADFKHLPPTVSAVYHFNAINGVQPYVGAGLNYTFIYDEELSSDFESAVGSGDMKLDDSYGLAFQAGVDYHLNEKWLINASARWIDIDTEAKIAVNNPGGPFTPASTDRYTADIEVDPWVYTVSVGYKF